MKVYKNSILIGFNQNKEIMIASVLNYSSTCMLNTYTGEYICTRDLIDENKVLKAKLLGTDGYNAEKITAEGSSIDGEELIYSVELKDKAYCLDDVLRYIDIHEHCDLFNTIAIVPVLGTYSSHEEIPIYIEELKEEDICNTHGDEFLLQRMEEPRLIIYGEEWHTSIDEVGETWWIKVVAYNRKSAIN